MVRLVRQLLSVLVAFAFVVGTVVPVVGADASVAAPMSATTSAADHTAMPCGDEAPTRDSGKAKLCPVLAVCAKCFQALPTVTAPIARLAPTTAAVVGVPDQHGEGLAPSPLLKPPRA